MEQQQSLIEEKSRSFFVRWQMGVAFFAFVLIGANDGAIGVLIPYIRGHYGVDKAVVSLLFLCVSAGYLISAFNSGLLVKKLGLRRFLLLGISALILGALSISIMPPFTALILPFFLIGFGVASLDTGLNAHIASLPRSTTRLNYLHAFYGAGALLGPIIASTVLIIGFTWNYTYSLWVFLDLLSFFGVVLVFKTQGVVHAPQSHGQFSRKEIQSQSRLRRVRLIPLNADWYHDETQDKRSGMGTVLRLPVTWMVAFFLFFYVGAEVSLGTWGYSFLTEQRHESALFSAWTVSGYWMGLTLGRIVLAKLASWLSERVAIQICVVGAMLGVLLTWLIPIGIVSAVGLCLTGFCLGPIFPTTMALTPQLFSQRLLATVIGLIASLGGIGGMLFPWLCGNLAQAFGLWIILPSTLAQTVIMLLIWLLLQTSSHGSALGTTPTSPNHHAARL